MKLVIEVSGGVVTNIEASDEASIYLLDHDNLEEGSASKEPKPFQPDFIGTEQEVMERLEQTLQEYAESSFIPNDEGI